MVVRLYVGGWVHGCEWFSGFVLPSPTPQVAWVGLSSLAFNRWITKEELVERGFEKLVNEYDGKLASEQKVHARTVNLFQRLMHSLEACLRSSL